MSQHCIDTAGSMFLRHENKRNRAGIFTTSGLRQRQALIYAQVTLKVSNNHHVIVCNCFWTVDLAQVTVRPESAVNHNDGQPQVKQVD